MKVGDDHCIVESMTETEITCRTVGGEEEAPTFAESKVITMMDQRSTSYHHRNYWTYGTGPNEVDSADECKNMCIADSTCLAFLYQDQDATWNGCWHIDFLGANLTDAGQEVHMADAGGVWHTWANAISGYVKMSDRQAETSCFSGRGEFYQGTLATTKYGKPCMAGTFCRNPSPGDHVIPYCQDEEGSWADCEIFRCDEKWGKYGGNRGAQVQFDRAAERSWDNLHKQDAARLYGNDWVNLDGRISQGKYQGFYADNVADHYNLKARNYFVAPFDGDFSFQISGDDAHMLAGNFNDQDGSYERLAGYQSWCSPNGIYGCNYQYDMSRRFTMAKGEKMQLQLALFDHTGGDYIQIGVGYHGKDETGTWIDHRDRSEMNQDSYIYDHTKLIARADGKQDYIFLVFKFDTQFVENDVGLGAGEVFDSNKRAQFRINWCGDDNNCFTSPDFNAKDSDIETQITDELKSWRETECVQDGTFSPQLYHGTYEDGSHWPGNHHFRKGQGAWCGRKAHEIHNHDIWNTNLGSKFSTHTYNDVCFAFKGNIEQLAVYGSFRYQDVNDKTQVWTGWMVRDVSSSWSSTTWKWHCFQITDVIIIDGNYYHHTVNDGTLFDIKYIRLQNAMVSPIYVDELRIGKMRGSSFTMTQTKKALSFNGQVPVSFAVWRNRGSWGNTFRIHINNWNDIITCGYHVNLPKILAPSGSNYVSAGDAETTNGVNWMAANPPFVEPWTNFIQDHLDNWTAPKDYGYMKLNYLDTTDNHRNIYDAWVMRRSMSDQEMATDMVISYGDDPTTLSVRFEYNFWPKEFTQLLRETWPELGEDGLNIDTYRGGWCNIGYEYYIRSHQHGNMKPFTFTGTPVNTRISNPRFEVKHLAQSAVVTEIMPGSVMATSHHLPQVVVTANGQRSACDNCDFKYLNSMTPGINQITTTNGNVIAMGESITLQFEIGSYTGTLDNVAISIGGAALSNCGAFSTSGSTVEVTCQVGSTGQGAGHTLKIDIPELGVMESTDTYEVQSGITSYAPMTGSTEGGTIVTVQGSGFAADQSVTISMGGSDTNCDSTGLDVSYNTLTCRTDTNANIAGGVTPSITSSQSKFSVIGGEEFTISGSNLDPQSNCDDSALFIGAEMAEIISWSDSEIVARSVAQAPSNVDIKVYVCNHGYSNAISGSVSLDVSAVSASFSSMAGGRELVIDGYGFATDVAAESLDVSVGDVPCDISASSANQITCTTGAYNNRLHLRISANGVQHYEDRSPADSVEIEVGTEVLWTWMISIPGTVPVVRIQRVTSSGDAETSNGQYWSEDMSGNEGKFLKHFTGAGLYHYSTGYIDSQTIFTSGTIRVIAAVDKPGRVSVKVNGIDANHVGSSNNAQPTAACAWVGTSTANAPSDAGYFVTYSWGATPVVNNINFNNPNVDGMDANSPTTVAHMFFNGPNSFDVTACTGDIRISAGDYECDNTSNTSGKQTCTLNPNNGLDTQESHTINANLAQCGDAYYYDYSYDTDVGEFQLGGHRDLTFAPYVATSSPQSFSRLGDVLMTITGNGFISDSGDVGVVFINGVQRFACDVKTVTYTEITCHMVRIASSLKLSDSPLRGFITFGDNEYPIQTNDFMTQDSSTPTITEYSPSEVSATGETLTITGTKLEGLVVTVGGDDCTGMTVAGNGRSATCTLPDLTTGRHVIEVEAEFGGVIRPSMRIQSNLAATSINPVAGGLNGGSLVTITGFGFDQDTVVEVYSNIGERLCEFCHVFSITSATELVFYSPRVSEAQTATVAVKHEYMPSSIAPIDFEYSDSSASVSGGSVDGDISAVTGGETLTISGSNFGSCGNLEVEIVRATDPCATGMHECSETATCTPTSDGMDYTCACNVLDSEWCDEYCHRWRQMGSGRECYQTIRRDKSDITVAEAACRGEYGESVMEINSQFDEMNLEQLLPQIEGSRERPYQRGLFVKWYGTLTCIRGAYNETTDEFSIELPGDCNTWGEEDDNFEKRVLCRRYEHRNCYNDAVGDRGRYTYNGRKSTSMSGKQCLPWDTTEWWDDYGREDLGNHNNYCRNVWSGDDGIACSVGKQWENNGNSVREGCGIPKCGDLSAGRARQQCRMKSFATRREDVYTYRFENDTWTDEMDCYFGSHHDRRLHNPHRCYYYNRFPSEFRFETVNAEENIYRVIRNRINDPDDPEYYLTTDPMNADPRYGVMWTETVEDFVTSATEIYVDENTFHDGTVTLRQGDYFISSGQTNSGYMALVHQDSIGDMEDLAELSWVVECTSDNFGALIDQPPAQFDVVHTVTPQCGSDVTVELPSLEAGSYKAVVRSSEYGQAVNVVDISYELSVNSVTPSRVGTGGGAELVITGTGFSDAVSAELCGAELTFISFTPASTSGGLEELKYSTVPFAVENCGSGLVLSSIDRSNGNTISTASNRKRRDATIEVDESLTPQVTMVNPKKGGTMGGTTLTIDGSGFGTTLSDVSVTIFDVACDVATVTDTQITCVTNAFPRDRQQVPIAPVVFIDNGPGTAVSGAAAPGDIEFWYVDRWSSPYTWGCTG